MNAIAKIDVNNTLARTFFKPVDTAIIDTLLKQYTAEEKAIQSAGHFLNCQSNQEILKSYFLAEHEEESGRFSYPKFSTLETAQSFLDAEFWDKALRQTDVYEHMPQSRRTEWHDQIQKREVPKFERETLISTLKDLLLNRERFFAERVEGIFFGLSREHVTNQPQGFSKRMIMYVFDRFGSSSYEKKGYVNDLRAIIAKFMGRDEPRYSSTDDILNVLQQSPGKWHEIDGGALRMRVYMKGTCHLEVHPDMAWRLNEILSWLYPTAIPAELRRKPRKEKTYKPVDLTQNLLPFAVVGTLANFERVTTSGDGRKYNVEFNLFEVDKHVKEKVLTVINLIGGAETGFYNFAFDYNPADLINEIVLTGQIPDQKAHQFYPTQESLAKELIDWADVKECHKTLEPQAGQGGLAIHLPQENLTCVEVSSLFCDILKKKGMQNVINADFVEWASTECNLYDRICMNPPFSMGRADQHLTAASKLLKVGGVLTAILPTGMKSKPEMPGFRYEWSEEKKGEFPGVSIPVVMLKLTRELYA